MTTHNYHNTGDFRGAAVFQGSKLTEVGEIVGTKMTGDPAQRDALQTLIAELKQELEAHPECAETANALASRTEQFVTEAAEPDADPSTLANFGRRLKETAGKLVDATPRVLDISTRIVELVAKARGLDL